MEKTKKLTVPDGWHEVTISQFQEIHSLVTEGEERTVDIISIFLNEDPEIIKNLHVNTLIKLIPLLEWSNKLPDDAIYKPIIKVNDIEYGIIPRFNSLSVGEWVDIDEYIKAGAVDNIHKIMSVLYRPLITAFNDRDRIIEDYDSDKALRQAELFKDKVSISDVYGALVFFCLIETEFMKIISHYLTQQQTMMISDMMKQRKKKKSDLRKKLKI